LNRIKLIDEILDYERIRLLRIGKGLSQEMLATKSELSTNFIGNIERGKSDISLKSLAQIAFALDTEPYALIRMKQAVDINELISNKDEKTSNMLSQIVYMLKTFEKIEISSVYLVTKIIFDTKFGAEGCIY